MYDFTFAHIDVFFIEIWNYIFLEKKCFYIFQESSIILSPNSESTDRDKNSPSPTKMIRSDAYEEGTTIETLQLTNKKIKKNSTGDEISESEVVA